MEENVKRLNGKVNKKSKLPLVSNIITFAYFIVTVVSIFVVYSINILPTKYIVTMSIVLLLIPIIIFFIQINKKRKKKLKIALNIFSVIASILLIIMSIYVSKTNNFLDAMQASGYKIENYSVIVLKESSYVKIEDIENKKVGYLSGEEKNIQMSNDELMKKVSVTLEEKEGIFALKEALEKNEIDAMLIEDSYKSILEENTPEFLEKIRVIYTFSIQLPMDEISKVVEASEPFNIYISGIDTYGKIQSVSRSDVNIVATVNPKTHQVLLINIPRDSYVQLYATSGTKDKLTHAGIYGIEKSVKTVEKLLDIDINYYFKVNFTSVEDIIDALGGVTVYSKYTFTSYIGNYYFKEGYNIMNGAQALGFARERKSFAEGDIMRGQNQQAVIEAMIRKATSPSIITRYTSLLNSVSGKFETNMPVDKITKLIKEQIDNPSSWNVTSITLDGNTSSQYTYSAGNQKLSVLLLDELTVENAKTKINLVMNGEVLESSYGEVTNPRNTTQGATKVNYDTPVNKEEKDKNDTKDKENDEEKLKEENHKDIEKDTTKDENDEKLENEIPEDDNNVDIYKEEE